MTMILNVLEVLGGHATGRCVHNLGTEKPDDLGVHRKKNIAWVSKFGILVEFSL